MASGILISFFPKQADARTSLWELNKKGFRRAAILHRSPGGEIHIFDFFTWTRIIGLIVSILVFTLAAFLLNLAGTTQFLFDRTLPLHTILLSGAITGTCVGLTWLRRSKFGIETKILDNYVQ